jgi:phage gp45-like
MTRLFRAEHLEADDTGDLQTITLRGLPRELIEQVHRVQPFGFHSNIPAGSHGFGLQFGDGQGGRLLNAFLGGEHPQYRPRKRDVGTTAIYDQFGSIVSLVQKEVRIVHASQVVLSAGGCSLTITKDGFAFSSGKISHDGKDVGKDHTHGGVVSGSATSGAPNN